MPYAKKWTDAQILRLHNEYEQTDLDLKTFCEQHTPPLPYKTMVPRFKKLARRLAEGGPAIRARNPTATTDVAEEEVATTVQKETAAEAKQATEQNIIIGKKVKEAYFTFAAKKGWDLTKIKQHPIDELVAQALEKADAYDTLEKRHKETMEALAFFQSRTNPLVRLERGMELLRDFLEMSLLMEAIGIDVLDSEMGEFYGNLIEGYLLNKPIGTD
ncbi:hypothetical protein ES702_00763 [subsurface metagenome]